MSDQVLSDQLVSTIETGNSKLGDAFTSLRFSQFQVSNSTAKIQDQQNVNQIERLAVSY